MPVESLDCNLETAIRQRLLITSRSGLLVDVSESSWVILPNKGKGQVLNVEWIYSVGISAAERHLILEVIVTYVRTKAASTALSVATGIKPYLSKGIPTLNQLKAIWSGLKVNQKKGLNQFFATLVRLAHEDFEDYHRFTSANLEKNKSKALDGSKGAFSEVEFDSLIKQINDGVDSINWQAFKSIEFYRKEKLFGRLKSKVANKLLLSIVRRPIQLVALKWADLIPTGRSFNDPAIRSLDEVGSVGGCTLQLRVYLAKARGLRNLRDAPERYPLHLSEKLSDLLSSYKQVVYSGLEQLMRLYNIRVSELELLTVMDDMPIFPRYDVFNVAISSFEEFRVLFSKGSMAYHGSEHSITQNIRNIKVTSDRSSDCIVSSNRIRHTVLTRGAQDGLSAVQLARTTGVTVPAARHYVDLDYTSRSIIDSKYAGNEFLKHAFSESISAATDGEDAIFDGYFNPVGAPKDVKSCGVCLINMGKPLGCYGCPNFRPMLEADHRAVLEQANTKLEINRRSLPNPLHKRSIEKIEMQIVWVKITIDLCDEIRLNGRALNA
ncbi:hypothetical protein CCL15_08805 [Pseudomonas syringae]|uniref:hypothetical protein n=1 Tax=Pseudomonas syringae TaxID=317 RepID=UPI000BB5CE75|nr:hypothetical protein [Pseudomonas syringae]PBP73130.1 hypothetical protein CCL15_08700 [Pseudomonas syringae]PBP73144.1 hypothetical protein CCL15_08805 [Pseudomonas syringae]